MGRLRLPQGLRSAFDALKASSSLLAGQMFYLTDEKRITLATGVNESIDIPRVHTGPTAPTSPVVGDIWFQTVPAWVPAGATAFHDFVNDRYYVNGEVLAAQADAIVDTRSTVALAYKADGTWQSFAASLPRITTAGLTVEPAATNQIRNNSNTGAVAGSPGTLPTNWAQSLLGLSREVVGFGTENGLPYSEHRFSGTATSGGQVVTYFETSSGIAAASGQIWTTSFGCKVVAAPNPPTSYGVRVHEYASGSSGSNTTTTISPTGTMAVFQGSRALNGASTTAVRPGFVANVVNGGTYDFTVRIYAPQCEQAAAASTPILTTSAASTRNADAPSLDLPSAGTHDLTITFDDDSTQIVTGMTHPYAIPTNLNRRIIKSILAEAA